MAIRIQLRRDTAANWTSANPVLRAGELGIETDTLKFKVGNGTSTWTQITTYANVTSSSLTTSLAEYIQVADLGVAGGPAQLTGTEDLLVPGDEIIMWSSENNLYTTTLAAVEPTAFRTINFKNESGTVALVSDIPSNTDSLSEGTNNKYYTDERAQDAIATAIAAGTHTNITVTYDDLNNKFSFAAAPGYVDEQAVDAVAAALAAGTHTNITVSYNDEGNAISLTGATTYSDENAQDAVGNAVGTGLSYNDSTGAISVNTTTIQERVTGVSDTEIGYLDGVTSGIQSQIDSKLALAGGTMTGLVTLSGAPTAPLHAATKAYVDNTTAGLNFHAPAHAATTAELTATYANGTDGVGATLTGTGTLPLIDGHTVAEQERVLVKNQSSALQNGIYVLTDDGDPSGSWVLTRATDADNSPAGEIAYGDFCFIQNGGQSGYGYIVNTTGTITIGSTAINYIQFSAGQVVIPGNGLTEPVAGTLAIDTAITADLSTAQTLTNKTLTSPIISTILNTGTLTLPTTTGTLALTSQIPAATSAATPTTAGVIHGFSSSTSNSRTTVGYQAGNSLTGSSNTAIGYNSLFSASTATDNTAIGHRAGYGVTSSNNTIIGSSSGTSVSSDNTIVGAGSVWGGSASGWTAIGKGIAGNSASVSGSNNVVIGNFAIFGATTASQNATLGTGTLQSASTASNNVATGYNAGNSVTTGSNNTLIGFQAGKSGTNNLTSGANNILIGANAQGTSSTTSNEIVIGNSSNTVLRIPGLSISATTTALTVPSLTPTNAIGAIYGGTGLTSYASGDILYASATDTLAKLAKGTDGQILTLASGVPSWAAAPITLPTQTDNSGKYLTTDGSTASWATLVVPIETGTATVTANTATTLDTTALSEFTSIEYMVSLKQGSKIRTSKVIVQTDGTSVDMTEFAITETGGTIAGVVVSAAVSGSDGVLQVTATDAATTNVNVKFSKVKL